MGYEVAGIDIKKIQNVQLKVLIELDRICRKHDIKYQLMAGTLLGSIRHKGFIPWDDDIDVCMIREDYNRFLKVCEVELNQSYFLQTNRTDPNYIYQFAKIRKNHTLFIEKSSKDLDIHHGVYIDIFPLDNILPGTIKGSIQQKALYILGRINLTRSKSICLSAENHISRGFRLFVRSILKILPKSGINKLLDKVATVFNDQEVRYVTHLTNGASKKRYYNYMMEKSEFYNIEKGEFEQEYFSIPVKYDTILSNLFGDYMKLPPEEQREPHHGVIKVHL